MKLQLHNLAIWVSFAFIFDVQIISGDGEITFCSYNVWNVMFSWEIRMQYIASMVKRAGCDVLTLQEVRLHADRSRSQADFLQQLLPEFTWVTTRLSDYVTKPEHSYWTGWEAEGLAVLSKLPLSTVRVQHLSKVHGPDTNQRIVLHVPVMIDDHTTVNVLVVHLSYHRQQQCQNAAELLQYIDKNKLSHVVVAGDFNVYPDFLGPVHLIKTGGKLAGPGETQCKFSLVTPLSSAIPTFQDTWEVAHNDSPGYSFSNMPEPGLTSRPDRIFTSHNMYVGQTSLHGHGIRYKTQHSTDIFLHRLQRVIQAARDTYRQHQGYSCLHDCGPHGWCRCGVCIKRDQLQSCHLPHCNECSSAVLTQLCFILFVFAMFVILAGTACMKILVVASYIDQSESFFLSACTCCLCNPLLIRQATVSGRHGVGRWLRCVGLGRLPPVYLLLLSLTLMVVVFFIGSATLRATLDTAADIMPEEYFPSDHLMVATKLRIK